MIAANNIYGLRVCYKDDALPEAIQKSSALRVKIQVNNLDVMDTALRFLPAYRGSAHGTAYMALPVPFEAGDVVECEAPDVIAGVQLIFDPPDGDYVMCPVTHPEPADV